MILLIKVANKMVMCNYDIVTFVDKIMNGDYDLFCYEVKTPKAHDFEITITNDLYGRTIIIQNDEINIIVAIHYDDNIVKIEGSSKNKGLELSIIQKILDFCYENQYTIIRR